MKKVVLALVIVAVTGILLTTVWRSWLENRTLAIRQTESAIEQVKEQYETELMSLSGVVGVGVGQCDANPCIKVYLAEESQSLRRQIPTQLNGFTVDTQVTGPIETLP